MVPGVARLRSSGTRRTAHWKASSLGGARHLSAAGAPAGNATRTTNAARETATERRPNFWTGGAGIAATLHTRLKSRDVSPDRCRTRLLSRTRGTRSTLNVDVDPSSSIGQGMRPEHAALAREWKRLSRAATVVAVLTSPALLLTFITVNDWPLIWSLVATFFAVVAFRGLIDVVAHRLIPRPSLWGSGET